MNIATRLKVSAEILLSITVIIMIIVAIKVISSGDSLGIQVLLSISFFLMFMWLGWIQPRITGIGLMLLGYVVIAFFGSFATSPINPIEWKILGVPILISGLLFLGASMKFHHTI